MFNLKKKGLHLTPQVLVSMILFIVLTIVFILIITGNMTTYFAPE